MEIPRKYAMNKTPNYTPGVHGPVLPTSAMNKGAVAKVLPSVELARRNINLGRKAAGMPPIELEEQLKSEAIAAVQTRTWSEFCRSAAKRLQHYKNIPQGLMFDGMGGIQTGQIRS
jgi:hypothetical protein